MIIGTWNCPVAIDCKHVAAVLFEALAQEERNQHSRPVSRGIAAPVGSQAASLDGPVGYWLQEIVRTTTDTATDTMSERVLYLFDVAAQHYSPMLNVTAVVVRTLKAGGYGQERKVSFDTLASSSAKYMRPDDGNIARIMTTGGSAHRYDHVPTDPEVVDMILR
ncbi:MAG: hypothetical protein HQL37_13045, partial [Alphaproteobacteria bacterium]|nr:hypothetical protein [Alphaproteobacteria bacterium]